MKSTLDMVTAVEYCENAINAGNTGFIMNTEFGRIGVELSIDKDMDRVTVNEWCNAPNTRWAMIHRNINCDYHVIILKGKTKYVTHSRVIEALSVCLLMNIFHEEPSQKVIDSAIMIYLQHIDKRLPPVNMLQHEYAANNINPIARVDSSVHYVIRELITTRWNSAEEVMDIGRKLTRSPRHGWTPDMISLYNEGYYQDFVAIILYMAESIANRDRIILNIDLNEYHVVFNSHDVIGYIDDKYNGAKFLHV